MAGIHHQLSIDAPAATVYEAIATPERIGAWWDKQVVTQTDRGLVLEHNPGPEHGVVRLRVVERIPNRRIEWECISTHPASSPASAWTGTRFIFELSEAGTGPARATAVNFRHAGYDEQSPFYGFNNFAWGQVLKSLKENVESDAQNSARKPS